MPIALRQATSGDGPVIHGLIGALAASLDDVAKFQSEARDFTAGLNSTPPAFEAVIAELAGTPIGICLYFRSFSSWRGTPGVYVQDLYVTQQARGQGLGQQLLRHVAGLAQTWGATYMRLAVDSGNGDAQVFYQKMGMHWADEDRIFCIDGDAFAALNQL